jgi:hypothetical protein
MRISRPVCDIVMQASRMSAPPKAMLVIKRSGRGVWRTTPTEP